MKCKMVFMLLCGMIFSIFSMVAQQVTNKIYIPEVQCGRGKTIRVPVALTNDQEVVALQFKLQLPSGCSLVNSSWGMTDRTNDHTLTMTRVNSNQYLVVVYSPTNTALRGNTGNLINFSLNIPETWEVGSKQTFIMEEPILSAKNGENILTAFESGALMVIADPRPDVAISAVKTDKTTYTPGDKIVVSWTVKNEGDKETGDGWSEQVSLVAENGESCYLGTSYYKSIVNSGGAVSRQIEFSLSDFIGIDGSVRAQVKLIPGANLGELSADGGNNMNRTERPIVVRKKLTLSLPSVAITENSKSMIQCKLSRSGSWSSEQVFSITADKPERLKVPETVKLPVGQSATFFYIQTIDNSVLNVDSIVKIRVEGNGYPDLTNQIGILDDEIPTLTLTGSKNELTEGNIFTLTIEREQAKSTDVVVNLTCDHSARFNFPAKVTIPAGEKRVVINVNTIEDDLPDVTKSVEFIVSAARHISGRYLIILNDDDMPEISLSLTPETISESAGPMASIAVLRRLTHTDKKVVVKLTDNSNGALMYSPTVLTLEKGVKEIQFTVGVIDNTLVDGDRMVDVTASVYISSCSCSADGSSAGTVKTGLKILDDDGPALKLVSSTTMLQEGKKEAAMLTISRNTSIEHDLAVTITSNQDKELDYLRMVTIPTGKNSITVSVDTKKNEVSGDDRTVVFTASSEGFTKGICWAMITDQTLTDAVISSVVLSASEVEVRGKVDVNVTVKNEGVIAFPAQTKINLYLSNTSSVWTSLYTQEVIEPGQSVLVSKRVTLPDVTGNYMIRAVVNEGQTVKELLYINNSSDNVPIKILPAFTVVTSTDKVVYVQGETVRISGVATGSAAANTTVEIYIVNENIRQTLSVQTDATGQFSTAWTPQSYQMGHFVVGACYPKEGLSLEQASFDIYGLRRTVAEQIICETLVGELYQGVIELYNPGRLPLTKLSTKLLSVPENCAVTFEPMGEIEGGARTVLKYTIKGSAVSETENWEQIQFRISTVEGAMLDLNLLYYCRSPKGNLQASVSAINTTMIKGISRDYSFTLTNRGKGETGKIYMDFPLDASWMTLATPKEMGSLKYGESATVILRLTPVENMQLNVPQTGKLGINTENANGFLLNYSIEPVSESVGKFVVDVCDEYTYYTTEAPHLSGALVTVQHPTTGTIVAQGTTDVNGLFTVSDLPEGYYAVNVTADYHDTYTNMLSVDPGKETKITVNLSFQAIKVDWSVEETEVEDRYDIVTTVKYETNVPMPVVELNMPDKIGADALLPGESLIFYATLINKGLITAKDVQLIMPTGFSTFTFEPIMNESFDLRPQEAVTIPIRVTKIIQKSRNLDNDPCIAYPGTLYFWDCGKDRKWHRYGRALQLGTCQNGIPPTPSDPVNTGGELSPGGWPIFPTSGIGGGWYGGSSSDNKVGTGRVDQGCEPCQNGFLIAGVKCASYFAGDAVETLRSIANLFSGDEDDIDTDSSVELEGVYDLLSGVANGFDNCVNGSSDGEKAYKCYKTFSDLIDKILDDAVGDVISDKVAAAKFKRLSKKILKWKKIMDNAVECAHDFANSCDHLEEDEKKMVSRSAFSSESYLSSFQKNISIISDEFNALNGVFDVMLGNEKEWNEVSLYDICVLVDSINWDTMSYDDVLKFRPQNLPEPLFHDYYLRQKQYNNELPESVKEELNKCMTIIHSSEETFRQMDYISSGDYIHRNFESVWNKLQEASSSVCSSITLQFSQTMTMTRQAFRGTLTVFNGNETTAMKDVKLNLEVKDSSGKLTTSHEFQINTENLDNFTGDLDGEWSLAANSTGKATILFIPTKYAAPSSPNEYLFGGALSYTDPYTNLIVTRELYPVKLMVKPSPNLDMTYFMQRDIWGDDPLTESVVEPMIPAEFSLLIHNTGHGDATDVRMVTDQPKIVDNEKGLLINFELLSSQLNGGNKTLALGGSVPTEFGTIPAQSTAYAQWWFQSSLLGHFTEYDVKATHVTSYGNKDLSLLGDVTIHELVRSLNIGESKEGKQIGFLVNDIVDVDDFPDMLYLSDGIVEDVSGAMSVDYVKEEKNRYKLTVMPTSAGWNYGVIADPTNGKQTLKSAVRLSDHVSVDIRNFWQTDRTLRDGKDPLYESRLHFVDKFGTTAEGYLLTYEPRPELTLDVESFTGGPAQGAVAKEPVTKLVVRFNKPIETETFTTEDLILRLQGEMLATSAISMTKVNDREFILDISSLTDKNGYYVLTIQTVGITDKEGFTGDSGKKVEWVQYLGGMVQLDMKVVPTNGGSVTPVTGTYEYASTLSLKAIPNEGFDFLSWSKAGGSAFSNTSIVDYTLMGETTLIATFAPKHYDVTVTYDGAGGTISGASDGIYEYNQSLTFVAIPVDGYRFEGWLVNNENAGNTNEITIKVKANTTVEAVFIKVPDDIISTYELPIGWTWLSFNVKDEKLNHPVAMLDPFKQSIVSVLGQQDDLVYDEQYGLYGSLQMFRPDRAYKMRLKGNTSFDLKGMPHASDESTITLSRGWNWIGFIPTIEMTLGRALANLTAEENDIIKEQDNFAIYDGSAWKGSLTTLMPQNGYMYYSNSAKSFNYPRESAPVMYSALRVQSNKLRVWQYNERKYADNMAIISKLYHHGGQETESERFVIGAFVGDECRGVSVNVDDYLFITVHGDNIGEKVMFRAFDTITGEEYTIKENTGYNNSMIGNLKSPLALHLGAITGIGKVSGDIVIYPSPVKDRLFIRTDMREIEEILIVDMNGSVLQRVNRISAEDGLDVSALTEGVYFVLLKTEMGVIHRKFMKLNNIK